jgi:hypothetical protein
MEDAKPPKLDEIPKIDEAEISLTMSLAEEPEITTSAHTPAYEVTAREAEGIARRAVDMIARGEDLSTAVAASGGSQAMLANPLLRAALKRT